MLDQQPGVSDVPRAKAEAGKSRLGVRRDA
jgi:hypothetical protein